MVYKNCPGQEKGSRFGGKMLLGTSIDKTQMAGEHGSPAIDARMSRAALWLRVMQRGRQQVDAGERRVVADPKTAQPHLLRDGCRRPPALV
jgi:hypothetical protein